MTSLDVLGLVFAGIAAAAGVTAAYFAWRSPSREDLSRVESNTATTTVELNSMKMHLATVEKNTADATAELGALKTHMAGVELHMREQTKRTLLKEKGEQIHVSLSGGGFNNEDVALNITCFVTALRLELMNENEQLAGTVVCEEIDDGSFRATIPSHMAEAWFASGKILDLVSRKELWIKAYVPTDAGEVTKKSSVIAFRTAHERVQGNFQSRAPYMSVSGQC